MFTCKRLHLFFVDLIRCFSGLIYFDFVVLHFV